MSVGQHFQGQGHQAALLTAVLARLHRSAAAVVELTVGKY